VCQRAVCRTCRKATYTECGQHVEQVLATVPKSERCQCAPAQNKPERAPWSPFRRR
jgi:hypothetical protein